MGIIRRMAVREYANEMKEYLYSLAETDNESVGVILIYSVWLRAMLEIENNLPTLVTNDGQINPQLSGYPILLREMKKWQKYFNKNGHKSKSFVLNIWVYSLRAIIRPEVAPIAVEMWKLLMRSQQYWDQLIETIKNEDRQLGVRDDKLEKVENHARNILHTLPPNRIKLHHFA